MLQLWKEELFVRELSRTQVQPLWQEGHLAKNCWEKHSERKPTAKLKAKAQPIKSSRRDKSRRKGRRKTKGRGKGNKFR